MIAKTTADIKRFAEVNSGFHFDKIKPFLKRAVKDHLYKYISKQQYQTLLNYKDSDTIILEAVDLALEVEVNLSMYSFLNVAAMQVTSAGVHVVAPKQQQSAAKTDIRDALRLYKRTGLTALDDLLMLLEDNEDKFTAWKNSKAFTRQKKLLINSTADFQKTYNIFNSTQTFLSLVPDLYRCEKKYINPSVTDAVLSQLKTKDTTSFSEEEKQVFTAVYEGVQDAIVLFTVSNTLGSGMYFQEASGFQLRFDVLDYERNFSGAKKLDTYILKQKEDTAHDAKQFLNEALELIKLNPTVFPSYKNSRERKKPKFISKGGIIGI
ncbi:hypothetical protein CXF68_09265 [Tenacibaculum sp. Bg11-29]|uniref:DUF6712 family protein n=1 Tax=Tenacibaculum sp. Bg11-29 TaxID=2058306 RepID=UPI000C337823|nr:DUF6712 family protein [Tenacibaculum sp. Bg11-29]PKH50863.1 hypothetical protein CXF68_09265 [Tenacibaculum sp. Bg11-29]